MGCLRNRRQQQQRRRDREADFAKGIQSHASALSRLIARDDWQTLTEVDRRYLLDAEGASQKQLSSQWGISLEGVKKRLTRLRKKINDL
jgi:DNA-binding CsgD family transcriptional regulator